MKKVSRSFALVVSFLEEPLRWQMSTAYLICRVLDNIEDCGQPFWWKEKRLPSTPILTNLFRQTVSIRAIRR